MGRPCTKCPPTTVQSCCGLRNLRLASLVIGFFKVVLFVAAIIGLVSILGGSSTGNKDSDKYLAEMPTGRLVLSLLFSIGYLFLAVLLIVGVFKKRRNYVIIYWIANWVWIVFTFIGLFSHPPGAVQWILVFCYTVADIYFQIVIRSHYLEMTGATAAAAQPEAPKEPPAYSRY